MTTLFEHRTFENEPITVEIDHKYRGCKFMNCIVSVPPRAVLVEHFGPIDPLAATFPGEIFDAHCEFRNTQIQHRPDPLPEAPATISLASWDARVEQAKAEGAKVIAPNNLPIRCITANGELLECEDGDHPDYKFPVEVIYTEERDSDFERAGLSKSRPPVHVAHDETIDWDHKARTAYCNTCKGALTDAEYVHLWQWSMTQIEDSQYEPHDEALVWYDANLALSIYETCPTLWRRDGGGFAYGPEWSKKWRLSDASIEKIWPGTTTPTNWDLCSQCFDRCKIEEKSMGRLQWPDWTCGLCTAPKTAEDPPHRVTVSWLELRNRYHGSGRGNR